MAAAEIATPSATAIALQRRRLYVLMMTLPSYFWTNPDVLIRLGRYPLPAEESTGNGISGAPTVYSIEGGSGRERRRGRHRAAPLPQGGREVERPA